MKVLRSVAFGLLALAGQYAHAQTTVTQWGVSAVTAFADCSVAFPCNIAGLTVGLWSPTTHTQSGGLNQTFASQIDVQQIHNTLLVGDNVNMGVTSAQVQLDNANLSVPLLKAKAAALDDNGWVSALAFGIQGYQYVGAAMTTATLTTALSGMIANPLSPVSGVSDVTGFSVGVWLLSPNPAVMFPSSPAATLGQLVASVLASTVVVDSWQPADVNAAGSVNLSDQLAIALDPGDEFYLLAGLVASATGPGRNADAFSTLTLSFDAAVTNALVPAGIAPVPEPQIYGMLLAGLGLLGTFAWSRKRKTAQRRGNV